MPLDLQQLEDRIAIEDCLKRYAHLIDSGQPERVAEAVFSDDADVNLGGIAVVGREAIHATLTGMMGAMAGVAHNITNILIDIRGDEAEALSRITGWHWFAGPDADPFRPADLVAVGGYQDRLRRTPAGWRIAHRRGMNFGTGVGIGTISEELKPIFQGMWDRAPVWPVG